MPKGRFYVFRLPLLLLPALLLLFGLGFGGWHYYSARLTFSSAEQIQQRLRVSLQNLDSYYVRFKTNLVHESEEASYRVEIWKSGAELYRMEMTRTAEEGQADVQVVIFDGSRIYLYNGELGEFYPVHDLGEAQLPYLVLEDYWRSLSEASQISLVAEEKGVRHSYYLVEVIPDQPHRERVREVAWLEAKSLLPVRIEMYDIFDSLTQVTIFEILQINPSLEATLFQVRAALDTEAE